MRVSTQMMYARIVSDLQNTASSLYSSTEKVSTGKKVNRASDDPSSMYGIITGKAQLSIYEGYQNAITSAKTLLSSTSVALDSVYDIITEAKQIGKDATSLSTESQATYVEMLNNLINSTIAAANTKVGGRYIFSGYTTDQPAVNTTTGLYEGTSDRIQVEIDNGLYMDVNITADEFITSATTLDNTTVIGAMTQLRTAIQNSDLTAIQTCITALEGLSEEVVQAESDVGTRIARMQKVSAYLTDRSADVTDLVSSRLYLTDVEIAALSADITMRQTSLQSLRNLTSNFLKTSLFDYL